MLSGDGNMALPTYHYPQNVCSYSRKQTKVLFDGCGSVGGVTVTQDAHTRPQVISQRALRTENIYVPLTPALPLLSPNQIQDVTLDPCLSEIKKKKKDFQSIETSLRIYKGRAQKKTQFAKEVRDLQVALRTKREAEAIGMESYVIGLPQKIAAKVQAIKAQEEQNTHTAHVGSMTNLSSTIQKQEERQQIDTHQCSAAESHYAIPKWLYHLQSETKQYIHKSPNIPVVNSAYTGGCISAEGLPPDGTTSGLLFYPSGPSLDNLCISKLSSSDADEGRVSSKLMWKEKFSSRILQVHSAKLNNKYFCCGRTSDGQCMLVKASASGGKFNCEVVGRQTWSDASPVSINVSRAIPYETVITLNNGKAYKWDPADSNSVCHILEQPESRFPVDEHWWSCDWAAHPRQLLVTDRTGVAIYDIRRSKSMSEDLFCLPHPLIHKNERIMVAKCHPGNPLYHLVATNGTIVLLDQRFPKSPVLHWRHSMQSAPQYLDVGGHQGRDVLVVGTQETAEVHAFHFNISQANHPPTAAELPWKLSRPSDMLSLVPNLRELQPGMLEHRFQCPLTGVATISNNSSTPSLLGIQMTIHGDLFYQKYQFEPQGGADKTMSAGPGSDGLYIPDYAVDKYRKWIKEVEAIEDEKRLQKEEDVRSFLFPSPGDSYNLLDPTETIQRVLVPEFQHVMCRLCSSHLHENQPSAVGGNTPLPNDVCRACGLPVDVAQKIHRASLNEGVVQTMDDGEEQATEAAALLQGGGTSSERGGASSQRGGASSQRGGASSQRGITIIDPDKYTDHESQILKLLWYEDNPNLNDLLVERDKFHENLKEKKKAGQDDPEENPEENPEEEEVDSVRRPEEEILNDQTESQNVGIPAAGKSPGEKEVSPNPDAEEESAESDEYVSEEEKEEENPWAHLFGSQSLLFEMPSVPLEIPQLSLDIPQISPEISQISPEIPYISQDISQTSSQIPQMSEMSRVKDIDHSPENQSQGPYSNISNSDSFLPPGGSTAAPHKLLPDGSIEDTPLFLSPSTAQRPRKRRRHSSVSSQLSVSSMDSLMSLGFSVTPERLKRQSRMSSQKNIPQTPLFSSVISSQSSNKSELLFSQRSISQSQSSEKTPLSQSSIKNKKKFAMGF